MFDRVVEFLILFFMNALVVIAVIERIRVDVVLVEEIGRIQWETLAAGAMGLAGGFLAYRAARAPHLRAVKQNSINFVISHYEDILVMDEFFDSFLPLVRDETTIDERKGRGPQQEFEMMKISDLVERLERFSGQISELENKLAIKILPVSQSYLRLDMLKNQADALGHNWQKWHALGVLIHNKKGQQNTASPHMVDCVNLLIELAPKVKKLRNVCEEYLSRK